MYGPKWMIQYEMPRFLKYTFVPSGPLTPHCFTLWTIIAQSLYLRQLMLKETDAPGFGGGEGCIDSFFSGFDSGYSWKITKGISALVVLLIIFLSDDPSSEEKDKKEKFTLPLACAGLPICLVIIIHLIGSIQAGDDTDRAMNIGSQRVSKPANSVVFASIFSWDYGLQPARSLGSRHFNETSPD